jgi:hypothetical protein
MEYEFHREIKAAVLRFAATNAYFAQCEYQLPNNKIADILLLSSAGKVVIIEVKTTLHDYHIRKAQEKYQRYCHAFYVAAPSSEIEPYLASQWLPQWSMGPATAGLLGVSGDSVRIIRQPIAREMRPSDLVALSTTLDGKCPAW